MKTLEQLRSTPNLQIAKIGADGGFGVMWRAGREFGSVIWSTGGGWDHVSVSPFKKSYTPSWDEMCTVKNMFFLPEETVVQYHPAESEYVNNMPNCLHLWRPQVENLPVPPSIMVGVKPGQTLEEALEAITSLENGIDNERKCVMEDRIK